MLHISSLLFKPWGWSVLPFVMRYTSLALRTLSRLEWTTPNGMGEMSLAVWWSVRKCFERRGRFGYVGGLVNWSAAFGWAMFKSSLVSPICSLCSMCYLHPAIGSFTTCGDKFFSYFFAYFYSLILRKVVSAREGRFWDSLGNYLTRKKCRKKPDSVWPRHGLVTMQRKSGWN